MMRCGRVDLHGVQAEWLRDDPTLTQLLESQVGRDPELLLRHGHWRG